MKLILAALVSGSFASFACFAAHAGDVVLGAEIGVASAVHDRGEQLGAETFDFGLGAGFAVSESSEIYGGVFRLLPFGSDQDLFDDEFDYTVGYIWSGETLTVDLSANYLTYPGESTEASLELMGVFSFDAPLSPELVVFYDADFEDYGAELILGHGFEITENWEGALAGYGGLVEFGDGSGGWTYIGAELAAERALTDETALTVYARVDTADEANFLKDSSGAMRDWGAALGVRLSTAIEL